MRLRGLLVFVAGLLVGYVIPVAAQADPAENQLVIRSDGFVFLIRNSQRHLISPVALTDDEINAFPEGEPHLVGLVPVEAMSAVAPGLAGSTGIATATPIPTKVPEAAPPTVTPTPQKVKSDLKLDISDVNPSDEIKQGEKLKISINTTDGATCSGRIEYKGGDGTGFSTKTAKDSKCSIDVTIDDNAKVGEAQITVKVEKDGDSKDDNSSITVTKK